MRAPAWPAPARLGGFVLGVALGFAPGCAALHAAAPPPGAAAQETAPPSKASPVVEEVLPPPPACPDGAERSCACSGMEVTRETVCPCLPAAQIEACREGPPIP